MSEQTIAAARLVHERDEHTADFDVCQNPVCRLAMIEINREAAIEAFMRGLRWVSFEKRPRQTQEAA